MSYYAEDHHGQYPFGNSSTEVFQKLLDGNYIKDPDIFYIPLPGKSKPLGTGKLKSENVCWDVTAGADQSSPSELPLVFMTGYRVTYVPGGSAVPVLKPFPQFSFEQRTWREWWLREGASPPGIQDGLAVVYNNTFSKIMLPDGLSDSDFSIPNFVPPEFKPDRKSYRQLTPDGVLP